MAHHDESTLQSDLWHRTVMLVGSCGLLVVAGMCIVTWSAQTHPYVWALRLLILLLCLGTMILSTMGRREIARAVLVPVVWLAVFLSCAVQGGVQSVVGVEFAPWILVVALLYGARGAVAGGVVAVFSVGAIYLAHESGFKPQGIAQDSHGAAAVRLAMVCGVLSAFTGLAVWRLEQLVQELSSQRADLALRARELAESKSMLARLLDGLPQAAWLWDVEAADFTYVSQAWTEIGGSGGESIVDQLQIDDHETGDALGTGGQVFTGVVVHASGDRRRVRLRTRAVGDGLVLGLLADITDEERSKKLRDARRDELNHAQRLESIGRLSGSIAHDFNNILAAIAASAHFLADGVEDEDDQSAITDILEASSRGSDLIRKLQAFGRHAVAENHAVDLNGRVRAVGRLVARMLPDNVELRHNLLEGQVGVGLDPVHLDQILLNLILNAGESMLEGGTVDIRTEVTPDGAVLVVEDEGEGMDAETLARCCEPFFTTKGAYGTGLGLATVHGLCTQYEGNLQIESKPGRGTRVSIALPLAELDMDTARESNAEPPQAVAFTVLVVDDDPPVRRALARLIRRHGHEVTEADGGANALRVLSRLPVDLVLTDVRMPGMGGVELFREMRHLHPEVPVIMMSGYLGDAEVQSLDVPMLSKPISPLTLVEVLEDRLSGPPVAQRSTDINRPE